MGDIIEAGKEHVEELTKLAMKIYTGSIFEVLKQELLELIPSDKHQFLLYIDQSKPIAFMHVSIRVDYVEGSESSPTGYLEGVYVEPKYRRKGISSELFQEGKKWLLNKGCKQIGSDMREGNQESYAFHMHIGFKEAGRLVTFIRDLG